jgi:hypothetical protein
LFQSVLEAFAADMSLDGRFLFWQFDARKSAEEEVLIGLVGHKEILIL